MKISLNELRTIVRTALKESDRKAELTQLLSNTFRSNDRDSFLVFLDLLSEVDPTKKEWLEEKDNSLIQILQTLAKVCPNVLRVKVYLSNIEFLVPTFGSFTRVQEDLLSSKFVEYPKFVVELKKPLRSGGAETATVDLGTKKIGGTVPFVPGKGKLWEITEADYLSIDPGTADYEELSQTFKEATDKAAADIKQLTSLLMIPKTSADLK